MSKQISQADAVFQATTEVVTNFDGNRPIGEQCDDAQFATIVGLVVGMFQDGTTAFKSTPANEEKLKNPSKLKSYVSGLVNNHHRKDRRLNGGTAYVPKAPGSRVTNPELKELKKLVATFEAGSAEYEAIQERMEAILAEIAAAKPKASVDLSKISPELKATLGLN